MVSVSWLNFVAFYSCRDYKKKTTMSMNFGLESFWMYGKIAERTAKTKQTAKSNVQQSIWNQLQSRYWILTTIVVCMGPL